METSPEELKKQEEAKEKTVNVKIVAFLLFGASIIAGLKGYGVAGPLAVLSLFVWNNNLRK